MDALSLFPLDCFFLAGAAVEAAAEEPNPKPGDELPGFLAEVLEPEVVSSSAEESCWDLMEILVGLGLGGVWRRRQGLLVVKDEEDDDGCSISAIFSLVSLDFFSLVIYHFM